MNGDPTGFVDAATVARHLAVERNFIYSHATALGAVRLGTGPKARLRFDLRAVDAAVAEWSKRGGACPAGRESEAPSEHKIPANRYIQRRRARQTGDLCPSGAPLLPIRG